MNIKAFILVLTQTGQDEVALKKTSNLSQNDHCRNTFGHLKIIQFSS